MTAFQVLLFVLLMNRIERKTNMWTKFQGRLLTLTISTLLGTAIATTPSTVLGAELQAMPNGCVAITPDTQRNVGSVQANKMLEPVFPSLALQVRQVVKPSVLASGGRHFLIYELDLQNYSDATMNLQSIDILSLDRGNAKTITTLDSKQLNAMMRPTGVDYWQYHTHPHVDANRQLQGGRSALAFLCLSFDTKAAIPTHLSHRVLLEDGVVDAPAIAVHGSVPVFGPPLIGTDWVPRNGPHLDSHHRMGMVVFDGMVQNARRFAIDWRKFKNGQQFEGDARDVHSYFAYGEKIVAVADGVVVKSVDQFPDNIPRTNDGFELALPLTRENLGGNFVIVALANGQFTQYFHMQPGSVRVKPGDRVKRGQVIGQVGNSGDSRWPHLHFQLGDKPDMFATEGLPFVINHFRMKTLDGKWSERSGEFPWGDETVIDFGESTTPIRAQTQAQVQGKTKIDIKK
jgi:hypothetical protein